MDSVKALKPNEKTNTQAHSFVTGNIEGIDQGLYLLEKLNDEQYQYAAKPYVESSTGAHLRHINDLYFALMAQEQNMGLINYDQRRRGALVETDRATGIQELLQIRNWLESLDQNDLFRSVRIQSETSIYQQQIFQMESTLQRELLFVSSHTTHHFSVIRVNAQACGIKTDNIFSYAPATASYLRSLK
ncbi:MAG: DinB family protein [Vibrio sp.]